MNPNSAETRRRPAAAPQPPLLGAIVVTLACVSALVPHAASAAAPNDGFRDAIKLSPGTVQADTRNGFGREPGEQIPCSMGHVTVWYRYTPASSGQVTVNTFNSNFDTVLAVYATASGSDGNRIDTIAFQTCNDDWVNTLRSNITFSAEAHTTYFIQAGGFEFETGDLSLTLSGPGTQSAVGDERAAPVRSVSGDPIDVTIDTSTVGAGLAPNEKRPCGSMLATVWLHVTPSRDGTIVADTFGSEPAFDTVLAVYPAGHGSLPAMTCNDDDAGSKSRITFEARAGTTYSIQAGGFGGSQTGRAGNLALRIVSLAGAPTGLQARPGPRPGEIALQWNEAPGQVNGYLVYRDGVQVGPALPATARTFTDTGLTAGQKYGYRVAALNQAGPGAKSEEACSRPFPWLEQLTCGLV